MVRRERRAARAADELLGGFLGGAGDLVGAGELLGPNVGGDFAEFGEVEDHIHAGAVVKLGELVAHRRQQRLADPLRVQLDALAHVDR